MNFIKLNYSDLFLLDQIHPKAAMVYGHLRNCRHVLGNEKGIFVITYKEIEKGVFNNGEKMIPGILIKKLTCLRIIKALKKSGVIDYDRSSDKGRLRITNIVDKVDIVNL